MVAPCMCKTGRGRVQAKSRRVGIGLVRAQKEGEQLKRVTVFQWGRASDRSDFGGGVSRIVQVSLRAPALLLGAEFCVIPKVIPTILALPFPLSETIRGRVGRQPPPIQKGRRFEQKSEKDYGYG